MDSHEEALLILVDKTELSVVEIRDLMEEKMERYKGLVNKEAAIHLIARDNGVNINEELRKKRHSESAEDLIVPEKKIADVVPGEQDIEIAVKVDAIKSEQSFDSGDGGTVRNVVVSDGEKKTQISLWNEDTDIADAVDEGNEVILRGVYAKENDYVKSNYGCEFELRLGSGSRIIDVDSGDVLATK